ncbi:MAG: ATP-binding protein [Thauera sp.]
MRIPEWKLRSFIIAITVITTLITVLLVGVSVLLVRLPAIERENEGEVQLHASEYAAHVKLMLGALESRLDVLGGTQARLPPAEFEALLEQMARNTRGVLALYLVARDGTVVAAGLGDAAETARDDILGSDLSATPLFRSVLEHGERRWSDVYLSAISGQVTVGLAVPASAGHVIITEVPLANVLDTVRTLAREHAPRLWVLDSRGEVVVELGDGPQAGRTNLGALPVFQRSAEKPTKLEFGGRHYHVGMAYSDALNWRFLTLTPAGLENPRIRGTVLSVLLAFGVAIFVSVLLSPTWARQLAAPLDRIVRQARDTARGGNDRWPRGRIAELNALSGDLEAMAVVMREREERFFAIFNSAPSPMVVTQADARSTCIDVNTAWCALFGWAREEVVGIQGDAIALWPSPAERDALFVRAAADSVQAETRLRRRSGESVLCRVSTRRFSAAGLDLIVWVIEDVTEMRRMEDELRALNVELEQRVVARTEALAATNRSLQQALADLEHTQRELVRAENMAALGNLVAGVAHELNTPVGNALMAISTLQGQTSDFRRAMQAGLRRSDLDTLLGDIDQATDISTRNLGRAAELVTSFKQVAVDQASSQRRRFALAEVIDEIATTLRPTLRRTPYALVLDVPDDIELDSYPGPLGQTLTNMINNALLHAFEDRDHGRILISARKAADGMIELDVSDDGKGIAAADLKRIFEPFFTTRMGSGGTGLGLHIAYNAVQNVLGGTIEAQSTPGAGSRFAMRLPARAPSPPVSA